MNDEQANLDADRRAHATEEARRALVELEAKLRRMGVVGKLVIGLNPARAPHEQWWVRCTVMPESRKLLVEGCASGAEAMQGAVQAIERSRRGAPVPLGKVTLWTPPNSRN